MAALTLFYSYAHEDEALRDQLEKHLVQLQRQGLISTWHDRMIPPGGVWADEIDEHLETASIILLLVSPDFLASTYCYEIEMQRALERHRLGLARVVPIILRPCDWQHSPLKDLQCLPRDGKPVTQWQDQDEVFLAITESLRSVIEQQARPFVSLSPLHRQNRTRMLKQVQRIWIDGLLTQSLHHAAKIELNLQDRPDVLANAWQLQYQELNRTPQSLPDGTTIVQVYDKADSELLILGEPGSGKTTLLLELTRSLLERAEKDERHPMPIVFNLSSWAEKRQPLRIWLVEELLSMKYQVPRKIGQGWIEADQVLPLLDGLDEVAKEARSACVEEINKYYQSRLEHGSSPIVVCCRSKEYFALSTRVAVQHAVSILPLTDSQISTYLEQAGEQVKGLRQALEEDTELHNLARQPLMLNIFTLAYQGARASDVPTGETREGMRHTIFARYVEHMLKRRRQSKRWKSEQVIHWLTFLAKQMRQHDQTVFSVENLQPTWLSKKWKNLYRWCTGLPIGLFFGLVFGWVGWWFGGLFLGQFGKVFFGLAGGLYYGLSAGLVIGRAKQIQPSEVINWSWEEVWNDRREGLFAGLVSGPLFGLLAGLVLGVPIGLLAGAVSGLLFGLGYTLLGGLSGSQLSEQTHLVPNESIRRSIKSGLFITLMLVLVAVLVSVLSAVLFTVIVGLQPNRLVDSLLNGLFTGLFLGLFLGLYIGQPLGIDSLVQHLTLRIILWRMNCLPWDLISFLDQAVERLLLRKIGGSYIFVHRLLLDYFAELKEKDGSHRPQ